MLRLGIETLFSSLKLALTLCSYKISKGSIISLSFAFNCLITLCQVCFQLFIEVVIYICMNERYWPDFTRESVVVITLKLQTLRAACIVHAVMIHRINVCSS